MKFILPFIFQCMSQVQPTEQLLGACQFVSSSAQPGIMQVVQNTQVSGDQRLLMYRFYNSSCEIMNEQDHEQIHFIRTYIWPWSEIDFQYLKYRHGKRGVGMHKWNRATGEGFLRHYLQGKQFYLELSNCQIDLTDADFSK